MAPIGRSSDAFDPGAKYHVSANTPYNRYFLAHILQFQFHKTLCDISGNTDPIHRYSIYGSKKAGEALNNMLEMGKSKTWQEALTTLTGKDEMDASAIFDYFAPLKDWLDEQNQGTTCGF
jgi:peptidyl-dipeptidase A